MLEEVKVSSTEDEQYTGTGTEEEHTIGQNSSSYQQKSGEDKDVIMVEENVQDE